jgi:predicted dehydrogenase
MIRACIIGVSGYGQVHYNNLLLESEKGRVQIVAAAVINQEEEQEKCAKLRELGCELFRDYREMLAKYKNAAELCFIPTGIPLHAPMTIAALEAGMNVYLEKPAAATVQEVAAMREVETRTGGFVAVGYQSMYQPDALQMKDEILSGRLGTLKCIKCYALWPRNDNYYARNNWAGKLRCGESWVLDSPYNNALAHQLNMICFLAGTERNRSAELASVQAELYRGNDIESADTASIRIVTATGLSLYFIVTHCPEKLEHPLIVARGDKGELAWHFGDRLAFSYADGRVKSYPVGTSQELVFDALLARMKDRNAFVCDLPIAGTQTLCVNGSHQSSPVRKIDARFTRRIEAGEDSMRTVIDGVDDDIRKAFTEEKLLSEIGVPWASAAPVFSLKGYDRFTGPAGFQK